jgi:hypothetical protein
MSHKLSGRFSMSGSPLMLTPLLYGLVARCGHDAALVAGAIARDGRVTTT